MFEVWLIWYHSEVTKLYKYKAKKYFDKNAFLKICLKFGQGMVVHSYNPNYSGI
jgi:hypothetical protein